jgi:arylsulfatase A-like enzyme
MIVTKKRLSLPSMLALLTSIFVLAQIYLLLVNASTTRFFDTAVSTSLTTQILHSNIFIMGLLKFLASQLLIYTLFVGLIWYLAVSIGELFSLREDTTYTFGIALLLVSYICVLSANYYFVPHSFFSNLIRTTFLTDPLLDTPIRYTLTLTSWILFTVGCLAVTNMVFSLGKKRNGARHVTALLLGAVIILGSINFHTKTASPLPSGTSAKPNIIIIGIDAMRPDFVGYYNKGVTITPHIDAFLQSGIPFSDAYTALPRTFPSWTSILTGSYPIHTGARGNNTDLSEIAVDATLPKSLQKAGYETIYSTDDTRFNNTNASFGFDHVVTPPMGLNDFLIGTVNDFPLSNLIITTPLGRLLFPYNYANHGTPITYDPKNFTHLLNEALQQREQKPLFMAVHFTVTHWPFYWFNDKLAGECNEICRYQAGIGAADKQMAKFFEILQANKLLDHAIVILLSDHGMSMGLPGDRVTSVDHYQGDKAHAKKLTVMKYSSAPAFSMDFKHNYGIDTSYGYGGDILSLTQSHAVLAFKGYGVDIGKAHSVSERILLMDIAPTILDLLQLPPLAHSDGISLKPLLLSSTDKLDTKNQRPLFFETSFTIEEIEKEGISVDKVLAKTVQLYRMDPKTGLIFIKKDAEQSMDKNKQEAIMQGDWLLAQYPESIRTELSHNTNSVDSSYQIHAEPPYMVLVNLKTGQWTMELDNAFAKTAPLKSLKDQLYTFYGSEIAPVAKSQVALKP